MKIPEIIEHSISSMFVVEENTDFELNESVYKSTDDKTILVVKFLDGYDTINKLIERIPSIRNWFSGSECEFDYLDMVIYHKHDNEIITCSLSEFMLYNTNYLDIDFHEIKYAGV